MDKKLFKCEVCGDIHWGVSAPKTCPTCQNKDVYKDTDKKEVLNLLSNLSNKKLWRCNICNDLHIGNEYPNPCPTCQNVDSYVEIEEQELKKLLDI